MEIPVLSEDQRDVISQAKLSFSNWVLASESLCRTSPAFSCLAAQVGTNHTFTCALDGSYTQLCTETTCILYRELPREDYYHAKAIHLVLTHASATLTVQKDSIDPNVIY